MLWLPFLHLNKNIDNDNTENKPKYKLNFSEMENVVNYYEKIISLQQHIEIQK